MLLKATSVEEITRSKGIDIDTAINETAKAIVSLDPLIRKYVPFENIAIVFM